MPSQRAPERGQAAPRWWLLTAAAINVYLLGAACLLLASGYPLLAKVAPVELPAFHAALTRSIAAAFILPELLSFGWLLPLLRWRPEGVPAGLAWGCVALGVAYFAITFGWHLPAHQLLAQGDASPPVMSALLVSHGARTLLLALRCGLLLWMIAAAFSARSDPATSPPAPA